jgi:hypothetical protein
MTINQVPEDGQLEITTIYHNTHYGFFPATNWSYTITLTSLGAAGFYKDVEAQIPANLVYSWTWTGSGNALVSGPGPNAWYWNRAKFWTPENYSEIAYQYYKVDFVIHSDDFIDIGYIPLHIKPDIEMTGIGRVTEDNTWETAYDVTQSGLNDFSGSFTVRTHPYGMNAVNVVQMLIGLS